MKKPLILQVSIPFCVKQCSFCRYPYCRYDPGTVRAYAKALLEEILSYEGETEDHMLEAVSIEGGSPALLGADALQQVIRTIRQVFHCSGTLQISLQTMPGDYSRALMEKMRDAGVNFYIIGLETAQPEEHEWLKRPYKFDAITMVDMAVRTFDPRALSFDVLTDIPGQTEHSLRQTLQRCLYYAPEHMSIYPLVSVQPDKPYPAAGSNAVADTAAAPAVSGTGSVPHASALFRFADEYLRENGFSSYTSWDYSRSGCKNRFLELWLEGCETIGIGYHSASWLDSVFWTTGHSLQEYLDNPLDFEKTTCSPVSISADALTLNRRNHYDQFKHRILC